MGTHNIYFYKEVDKKYTGCNLKTMELLDSALKGVCVVIRKIRYSKKVLCGPDQLVHPPCLVSSFGACEYSLQSEIL